MYYINNLLYYAFPAKKKHNVDVSALLFGGISAILKKDRAYGTAVFLAGHLVKFQDSQTHDGALRRPGPAA